MRRIIIPIIFILFIPFYVFAGPPVFTSDTGTPGNDKWEINNGFFADKRISGNHYEFHAVDINYGVGEHVQIKYEIPWVFVDSNEEGTKNGLGNSNIGLKYRFLDEDKKGIAISIYPQFEFNTSSDSADRGIVDKGNIFLFPIQVEKKIKSVNVNLEIGHAFHQHGEDEWIYGIVFERNFFKNFEALAEIHGEAKAGFKHQEVIYDFGFRQDFNESFGIQMSAGRSFSNASDQSNFLFYVGIQFRS